MTNELDNIIKEKFKNKSNKQLIAIINNGKANIDDESYELNRRGVIIRFNGDQAYIYGTKLGKALSSITN
jgi:5-keto 4-deoxyuronate isomerase